jgi:hypothetical protein
MEVEFPWPSREIAMRKLNSDARITMKLNSQASSHNFREFEFSKPKGQTASAVYVTLKLVKRPSRRGFIDSLGAACSFFGWPCISCIGVGDTIRLGARAFPSNNISLIKRKVDISRGDSVIVVLGINRISSCDGSLGFCAGGRVCGWRRCKRR